MPHSAGNQSVERENGGGGDRPTDGPSGRAGYRSRTIFPFVEIGWNVVPMQSVARMSEVTCLTARGFVKEHISFVMTLFSSPHRRLLHFFCFFNSTNLTFSKAWCRPVVGAVSQSVGRSEARKGGKERRHLPKQWDTFSRNRDRRAAFLPSILAFLPIPTSPISLCSFSYGNFHLRHPQTRK